MQRHLRVAIAATLALAWIAAAPLAADVLIRQTSNCDRDPAVAYNSSTDEFLVAMLEDPPPGIDGPAAVKVCRVSPQGDVLSGPTVSWDYGTYYPIELYYNSVYNHYVQIIAYTWYVGSEAIYAQFLDGLGNQISSPVLLIEGIFCPGLEYQWDRSGLRGLQITYNSLANEYFVSAGIQSSDSPNADYYIKARRMSPSGVALGSVITLDTVSADAYTQHGIAYAPVSDSTTPTGRYILVRYPANSFEILNANGTSIEAATLPDDEPPGSGYWDWNAIGHEFDGDVAFGNVNGKPVFLLVFEDGNNKSPYWEGHDHTGLWAFRIDADSLLHWQHKDMFGPFPITSICYHDWWLQMQRVEFDPHRQQFVVIWREVGQVAPPDYGCTTHLPVQHVRGMRVGNAYLFPGDQNYSPNPIGENVILSKCSGTDSGDQQPLRPQCAVGANGEVFVVWDDIRNFHGGHQRDIYGKFWDDIVNDQYTNATDTSRGLFDGTLIGATNDGNADCGDTQDSADVWFTFTAPSAGDLTVSTCGTNDLFGVDTGMDTVISLHDPFSPQENLPGMCNDDWPSSNVPNACVDSDNGFYRDSALKYTMSPGEEVLIRIASYYGNEGDDFILNVDFSGGGGIPGDVDGDGDVDQADLGLLLAAYGSCDGDPNWNPDADFDGDGCIGQPDLGVLLANYDT
ncbi:MAG: hypothetical protein ACF8NJ_01400 [Phycisphaerales bacterium JB038]